MFCYFGVYADGVAQRVPPQHLSRIGRAASPPRQIKGSFELRLKGFLCSPPLPPFPGSARIIAAIKIFVMTLD